MSQVLSKIGEAMRTQNNRATAWPVFVVQQRRRLYGFHPDYSDNVVWLNQYCDSIEADAEEAATMEAQYYEDGTEPDGWLRTSYVDIWEHVTTCFTEDGANAYIKANGHNLKHPRVYVESAYRNAEWQAVAKWLVELPA